jgi:hypothetical protein
MKTIHTEFRTVHDELRKVGSIRKDVPALILAAASDVDAKAVAAGSDKARAKRLTQEADGMRLFVTNNTDAISKLSTLDDTRKVLSLAQGGGWLFLENHNQVQGWHAAANIFASQLV